MKGLVYLYHSYLGHIKIIGQGDFITGVYFVEEVNKKELFSDVVLGCKNQLEEYFNGKRRIFELKLKYIFGTPFQQKCWDAMQKVPYGKTISYKQQAAIVNNPKAMRAVGGANGKNPISIIIPCHRIIGDNGKLVGFGAGLWRKKFLLNMESIRK